MHTREFDVVVVGGGIVGSVQALLLAQQGISVLLIEAAGPETKTAPLQQRSVALSYRSYELLASAGLWPSDAVCAIHEIQVTNRGSFGSARITADDLNSDALGYVVANHGFEHHLRQLLNAQQNIEILQPATATLEHHSDSGAELRISPIESGAAPSATPPFANTEAHMSVRCRLLIAADGTHSQIRQSLGLGLTERHYDQVAVVANVECQHDHQHIAYERFTDSGPLALLPLAPRCMAMVYSARADDAEVLKAMGDAEFLQKLQRRFGGNLGRFRKIGRRAVFPLILSESESQTVGCCVMIGNSARTLHPVAGQGLNLALRDVVALTAIVGPALHNHAAADADDALAAHSIDWHETLAGFQQQRGPDQQQTVRRTDLLARLFSDNSVPGSGVLRGVGLLLLNGLAPLRKRFAEDSAGIGIPLGQSSGPRGQNRVE